jgi:3-(3-hydroxy-phenyl)propionate hydroxylase
VQLGSVIQTTQPDVAHIRDGETSAEIRNFVAPQPKLGPGAYLGGQSVDGQSGINGNIAPQPRLSDGRLLDDVAGYRFALVMLPELLAQSHDIAERASRVGARIVDDEGAAVRGWLGSVSAAPVLVRPDRYVYGIAHDSESLQALLDHALPTLQTESA